MLLENRYYQLVSQKIAGERGAFHVRLLPECAIYQGHFPGNPICPGVCQIEMIKECATLLTGRDLRIRSVAQCRLTALASPTVCPELEVEVLASSVENGFLVRATVSDDKQKYVDFKGEMICREA